MADEHAFRLRSDAALEQLYKALVKQADQHDFECDYGGTLTVEFDEPAAKFVVSPNAPVEQIWVSAQMKSYKLSWDEQRGEFVLPETGQSLRELMAGVVSQQLGESVAL
ncbi:MAG TPA: iron donor protein CyaY [Bryobacteraceae bacterium]|nr:iron donor protein CyaY [Bryobacteraceae bacterium]